MSNFTGTSKIIKSTPHGIKTVGSNEKSEPKKASAAPETSTKKTIISKEFKELKNKSLKFMDIAMDKTGLTAGKRKLGNAITKGRGISPFFTKQLAT